MQITGSSSIAAITFADDSMVNIRFTSSDKEYGFRAKDLASVQSTVQNAIENDGSVGKVIAAARREGLLTAV
jgi:hypothetical protein|tara:strand:- start:3331 stop:3546 length:216 start_codon:yes stop_codon:yes gene_type:complete